MEKFKKIGNIVGNVIIWTFVAFSLAVTIMVFSAQQNTDGIPALFGKSLLTIQTPSMEDTYSVGDMVFMTKLSDEDKLNLKANDIITYHAPIDIDNDGRIGDINTHRIVSIDHTTGLIVTKGDGNLFNDNYTIHRNDVIGLCTEEGKLDGVGGVIEFLRSRVGFFICIVLPLILFFVFELYNFITILVSERSKKATAVAALDEEEIKKRAIEEYLAAQAAKEKGDSEKQDEDK